MPHEHVHQGGVGGRVNNLKQIPMPEIIIIRSYSLTKDNCNEKTPSSK